MCSGTLVFVVLNSSKLFDRLLNGVNLFNKGIHRMFAIVELLSEDENLRGVIARYNNDAVLVGDNNVTGGDFDPVAVNRHIHTAEAIVTD